MGSGSKKRLFDCDNELYDDVSAIAAREIRKIGPQIEYILREAVRQDKVENPTFWQKVEKERNGERRKKQ